MAKWPATNTLKKGEDKPPEGDMGPTVSAGDAAAVALVDWIHGPTASAVTSRLAPQNVSTPSHAIRSHFLIVARTCPVWT
jgi:hypothetical protein